MKVMSVVNSLKMYTMYNSSKNMQLGPEGVKNMHIQLSKVVRSLKLNAVN